MSNTHVEPLFVVSRPLPETVALHSPREHDRQPAFEQHLSLAGGTASSKQKQERPAHSEGRRRTGSHPANEPHDDALSHQSVSIPQITIQRAPAEVAVTSVTIASDESEPTDADAAASAEQIVLANSDSDVAVHVEVVVNDEALLTKQADDGAQADSHESHPNRQGSQGLDRATAASKEDAASTPTGELPTAADSAESTSQQVELNEQQPTREGHRPDGRGVDSPREPIKPTSQQPEPSRQPSPGATDSTATETGKQSIAAHASGKAELNSTVPAVALSERGVSHDAEPDRAATDTSAAADEPAANTKGDKFVAVQQATPAVARRTTRSPSNTARVARPAIVQPAGEGATVEENGELGPDNVQLGVDRASLAKAVLASAEAEAPPAPNVPPNAAFTRDSSLLASGGRANSGQELPKVDVDRFLGRVTRAFHTAQQRGGMLQLRLSPPELGSLRLEITISDGAMSASLETETAAARRLLLDNLPALRDRLAEQNVRIDRFDVDVRRDDSDGQADFGPRHDRRQSQHSAPQRRSVRPAAPSDDATTPPTAPRSISTTRINVVA